MLTLFRRDRAERLESLGNLPRRLGSSSLLWVDLERAPHDVVRELAGRLELDEQVVEALRDSDGGPAFRDGGTFVHVTAQAPGSDPRDHPTVVQCVVGETWIVTSHDRPVPVLGEFAELAKGSGSTGELDGPSFLAALLEWVLNEYVMAFEHLEEQLEELDTKAMRGDGSPEIVIETLVELRACAGRLRRSLVAHRGVLLALAHPELEALGDGDSGRRFAQLLDRYESTLQIARDVRESVVSSFEVLIARTGQRTNEIVKILTLASVIFLPGAVVAGVMGMNFKMGFFEQTIGFWIVGAVIVAIGVATVAVARRRDWI